MRQLRGIRFKTQIALPTLLALAIFGFQPGNAEAQDDHKSFSNVKQWYESYRDLTAALHTQCEKSVEGVKSSVYSAQCARFIGAAAVFSYFPVGIRSGYGVDATPDSVLGLTEAELDSQDRNINEKVEALKDSYLPYRGDFPSQ
ncbi:MAG: hypothetical protein AAFV69_12330 [Pseudomonadota bacterium]